MLPMAAVKRCSMEKSGQGRLEGMEEETYVHNGI